MAFSLAVLPALSPVDPDEDEDEAEDDDEDDDEETPDSWDKESVGKSGKKISVKSD